MDAAKPLLQNREGNARAQKRDRSVSSSVVRGKVDMKHPSTREFFAYWDEKRGSARAPDRSEIEPGAVRELLGDIFVLSYDAPAGYPFRVAGTRVCALLGGDLKDRSFSTLFAPESRREIADIIAVVSEEMLAAVAGLTATAQDGSLAHLELLLLPFSARAHAPLSLTGLLAPFEREHSVLRDFKLTSYRYLGHERQKLLPRALRKLEVARGFMVYEGLR
jgi:hypothetical protein